MDLSRQHPLAESLGGLNRERLFQRVLLRGLSQEDVRRFIDIASGLAPPTGLVEAVHTQTEGNPLFVTEVVRLLVQEGEMAPEQSSTRESWTVRIPEGVREVIGRRLNRLSQRCNETLTMASVIGREFELRQLTPLIQDMSEGRLLEVLEEALAARFIEELPQAVGRYQFTHALIQETLAGESSATRRVRLHARIAEMLEEIYGDDVESHSAELARHYAQAETVVGTEKLVRYSMLAGERALASCGYEDALEHFDRALAVKEGHPIDADTAALLFGLGRSQIVLDRNRQSEAIANIHRAFDYYADNGEVERAVIVAEYQVQMLGSGIQTGSDLVSRALNLVTTDSKEEARLLIRYGVVIGVENRDYQGAQTQIKRALAIARRLEDPSLEMRALAWSSNIDYHHMHWEECLESSQSAIELSSRTPDDLGTDIVALGSASAALFVLGKTEEARNCLGDTLATGERLRDRYMLGLALWRNENLSNLEGDWESARRFSDRSLEVYYDARPLATRVLMEYQVGNFSQGESYLEQLLETPGRTRHTAGAALTAMAIPQVARMTGTLNGIDAAKAAAKVVLSPSLSLPLFVVLARSGLALLAVQQGDAQAAQEQYFSLEALHGTALPVGTASLDRILGLLSLTLSNFDQAAAHFDDALRFCRKAGYRPELAWTCCDYADMLRERDSEGDRAKAITLLDESLAISSELGMRPLMERVLARKLEVQGVASVDIRTSIDHVAAAVQTEQPDLRPHTAPDGTVTIMFSDIESSTEMTERLGDQRMQQVLRGHNDIVRHQVAAYGGFEVKSLGDGFMLAFSSARRGLQCAMAIQRAFFSYNKEHPDQPVLVRIGLHTGEFVQEMDDFFGKNVILASRIADQAQGGEILVSSLLKELTDSAGDISFGEGQEVELKGLAGLNRVYQVVWD